MVALWLHYGCIMVAIWLTAVVVVMVIVIVIAVIVVMVVTWQLC